MDLSIKVQKEIFHFAPKHPYMYNSNNSNYTVIHNMTFIMNITSKKKENVTLE